MSDAQDTASRIRLALYDITEHFVGSLPLGVKAVNSGGMPGAASKEAPLPVPARVLDQRIEAHRDLHFWAGFIMGTVTDIRGRHIKVYVDALDPIALARFLIVWADQLAKLEPVDATQCADEMTKHAANLKGLAVGDKPEGVVIGRCPVVVDVDPCGATVRAIPGEQVTCPRCGTAGDVGWWQSVILASAAPPLVTAGDLISIVALETRQVLTHEQIRQWATRGKIERAGNDVKGRTLYDHQRVVEFVTSGKWPETGVVA